MLHRAIGGTAVRHRTRYLRRIGAAMIAALLTGVVMSGVPRAHADGNWTYVYGDPGPQNFSRYQSVAYSNDGGVYLSGFFSGTFNGLTSPSTYTYFLQRIEPNGIVTWTKPLPLPTGISDYVTLPPPVHLVTDGLGNLFADVCVPLRKSASPLCRVSAIGAASGAETASYEFPDWYQNYTILGARTGGLFMVTEYPTPPSFTPVDVARRLTPALTEAWEFSLTAFVDIDDSPSDKAYPVAEAPDGSFWLLGTKKRPLPTLQDALTMVHLDSAGALIASVKHFGYTIDSSAPSLIAATDDHVWARALAPGQTPERHWLSFATSDGHLLGEPPTLLPSAPISLGDGTSVDCGGLDLRQATGVSAPASPGMSPGAAVLTSRILLGGTRLVVIARCTASPATLGPMRSGTVRTLLLSYSVPSTLDGAYALIAWRSLSDTTAITAMDANSAGDVVVAGSTLDGVVFAGPVNHLERAGVAAGTEHAVASLNPSGNLLAGPLPSGGGGSSADFTALTPARLFDTREAEAQGAVIVAKGKVLGGGVMRVKVTGAAGVPLIGVGAVSLNVTAVGPDGAGYATVYPCGDVPLASNLNFVRGQTVANAVLAPVSAAGEVCFFTNTSTYLLADVNGWFSSTSSFKSVSPVRVFDTRPDAPQSQVQVVQSKVGGANILEVHVAGVAGVPAAGVGAVSLNVTAVDPDGAGYVTAFPCGVAPLASNLNFAGGQTVPNAVIAPVSASGDVCFYSSVPTHLLSDVNGWFASGASFSALAPTRLFDTRPSSPQGAVVVDQHPYSGENILQIHVGGVAGVPASGVSAVALNVTAVDPLGDGYVTVYPCGTRPLASNLNFTARQTVPNAVIAPLSAGGDICVYANVDTHLLADVTGWFSK